MEPETTPPPTKQNEPAIADNPLVPEQRVHKQHKWLIVIIASLLLFAIISLFMVAILSRQSSNLPNLLNQPTPTLAETSQQDILDAVVKEWLTYTNPEHSYAIKYPKDWEVRDLTLRVSNPNTVSWIGFAQPDQDAVLIIEISQANLNEILNQARHILRHTPYQISLDTTGPFADQEVNLIQKFNTDTQTTSQHIVFPHDRYVYHVTLTDIDSTANQILSTFEFVDIPQPTIPLDKRSGCQVVGCNNEWCLSPEEASVIEHTCDNKLEYVCYQDAVCQTQPDGQCGWEQTPELTSCLDRYRFFD